MIKYSLDELRLALTKSFSFSDLCINLGYTAPSTSAKARIKKDLILNNIDFSFLNPHLKRKINSKYKKIKKICPVCKIKFETLNLNSKREKTYCSQKCCNQIKIGNRHSPNSNLKTSQTLLKKYHSVNSKGEVVKDKKECPFCKNLFIPRSKSTLFCSRRCQSKHKWTNIDYKNKMVAMLKKMVVDGTHKGWSSRSILSYPEKFFKKVLEINGFKGQFIVNHPIRKNSLGIECDACYFLDFYFPALKLDLEIDGKQHKEEDRKNSDKKRDESLRGNGYIVYRIDWVNISKDVGKLKMKEEISKFFTYLNGLSYYEPNHTILI